MTASEPARASRYGLRRRRARRERRHAPRGQPLGLLRIADERRHLMPGAKQRVEHRRSDVPRPACQKNPHDVTYARKAARLLASSTQDAESGRRSDRQSELERTYRRAHSGDQRPVRSRCPTPGRRSKNVIMPVFADLQAPDRDGSPPRCGRARAFGGSFAVSEPRLAGDEGWHRRPAVVRPAPSPPRRRAWPARRARSHRDRSRVRPASTCSRWRRDGVSGSDCWPTSSMSSRS